MHRVPKPKCGDSRFIPGSHRIGQFLDVKRIACGCLMLATLGLIVGTLGRFWLPFDVLSHFRGHFIGAALGSIAALIAPRFKEILLIGSLLATVLFHAWMSGLVHSGNSETADGKAAKIKIISLNTWTAVHNVEQIKTLLLREDPDVVVLSEFSTRKQGLLDDLTAIYPHSTHCSTGCRMALLSKRKWRRAGSQPRTATTARMIWAEFTFGGTPLLLVGVHMNWPTGSTVRQMVEIRDITKRIGAFHGSVILAGDMNLTRWSHKFEVLREKTGLRGPHGIYPSWPVAAFLPPQLAIDHFLVSETVTINRIFLANRVGSDHLPLVGVFGLRSSGRNTARLLPDTAIR